MAVSPSTATARTQPSLPPARVPSDDAASPGAAAPSEGPSLGSAPSASDGDALAEDADPLIGQIVGSFRVLRELGRGGMGVVYLGEHVSIGSRVAIKFLHPHLASNAEVVQRFWIEAKAVNVIGHANIVSIFDINVLPPGRYYLVMEHLEGVSLQTLIRGPVPPAIAIPILVQICDALEAAHRRGIVHRDLKPENVLLVQRGREERFVKILDFGIAKLRVEGETGDRTMSGSIMGTPDYMSPEQATGEPIDGRSDLYSLGIMAYELATGRVPFSGAGIAALLMAHAKEIPTAPHLREPSVDLRWSANIMKALAKRPSERFQSALEFGRALEDVLQSLRTSGPALFASPASRVIPLVHAVASPQAAAGARPGPPAPSSPPPPSSEARPALEPPLEEGERARPPLGAEPPQTSGSSKRRLAVEVKDATGASLGSLVGEDLTRGGIFLCADEPFPPLRAHVRVQLPELDGFSCSGEVVRHVSLEQARAWRMSPGYAVQFDRLSPPQRALLDPVAGGLPISASGSHVRITEDDTAAAIVLERFTKETADHYAFLGLSRDAEFEAIRARVREGKRLLMGVLERPLSSAQRQRTATAQMRLQEVFDVLAYPMQRLEYDAKLGNFEGVYRCILAGVAPAELEGARKRHLARYPGAQTNAHLRYVAGLASENAGAHRAALQSYEQSLRADPLNLKTQQRYWALRKRAEL